jgi:hypothetical protein
MRSLRVVGFIVLVFIIMLIVQPLRRAYANHGSTIFTKAVCNSDSKTLTIFGTNTSGSPAGWAPNVSINGGAAFLIGIVLDAAPGALPPGASGSVSYSHPLFVAGAVVVVTNNIGAFGPGAGSSVTAVCASQANVSTAPAFFDPGDIRVDGWAGDRLAVYCPSNKQLQVIGIGANGKGAGVAVFDPKDLIAAGKAGLSLPLKSYVDPNVDLGRVTVQMILNDGVTSFYIAWNGGILNATGQGDFKKMFVTPIRFCPFTFR